MQGNRHKRRMIKMGKIIDNIFGWSVEDLRQEFCIELDYKLMKLRVSQIKDKFAEIKEMMDKQLESHNDWD